MVARRGGTVGAEAGEGADHVGLLRHGEHWGFHERAWGRGDRSDMILQDYFSCCDWNKMRGAGKVEGGRPVGFHNNPGKR